MTPPLYLTRADDWVGGPLAPIAEQEWWAFAQSCTGLVCESRIATMEDRGGNRFSVEVHQPVFLAGSNSADEPNCLYWENGYVVTSGEPSEALVAILLAIASRLGANVQDSEFVRLALPQ